MEVIQSSNELGVSNEDQSETSCSRWIQPGDDHQVTCEVKEALVD